MNKMLNRQRKTAIILLLIRLFIAFAFIAIIIGSFYGFTKGLSQAIDRHQGAHLTCLRNGYSEVIVTGDEFFCSKQIDGTDFVIPIIELQGR